MKHCFRTGMNEGGWGLSAARAIMVNMPEEVFNIWLGRLIGRDGSKDAWPFVRATQSTHGTRWHQYLDGHSIQAISNLRWRKQQIPASPSLFVPNSRTRLQSIIDAHVHGLRTPCPNLQEGQNGESFLRSRDFVLRTSRLPRPAILIRHARDYQIMDGNDRLAAFLSVPHLAGTLFECWVGEL